DEWTAWVIGNIPKRYQGRALVEVRLTTGRGASSDEMVAAARHGAAAAEGNYYATSALILGLITLGVAFFCNAVSVIPAIFGVVAGIKGMRAERMPLAIVGLVLTAAGVLLGIALVVGFSGRR
ncbi:MAG: hypothetical protein QOE92_1639, partial [Chloroflexota bacterium]|nr:hypothetical protein [Chloroflexota bacterium]